MLTLPRNALASMRDNLAANHWFHPLFVPEISGTFNSLFKVLFTFPSWYLYSISLEFAFSFRWNLPPTLRSNPKERDSPKSYRTVKTAGARRGCHPLWRPFPGDLHLRLTWYFISRLQLRAEGPDFQFELFPVQSPLLRESFLVFVPPLSDMLKFSG